MAKASDESSRCDSTLIFLHVPKTAGCSLSKILVDHFTEDETFHIRNPNQQSGPIFSRNHGPRDQFQSLPSDERAHFRCVLGHMQFGLHQSIPSASTYVTLLRDPVERVLSQVGQFNRMVRTGQVPGQRTPISVEEFCRLKKNALHNHQARLLCGWHFNGHTPEENLKKALENLESHFSVVGTTEQFDLTLRVICDRFNWPRLRPRHHNRGKNRLQQNQVDPELLKYISENNEIDRQLHEYANRHLQQVSARLDRSQPWIGPSPQTKNGGSSRKPKRPAARNLTTLPERRGDSRKRILIDASQLTKQHTDGIRRYTSELLRALQPYADRKRDEWNVVFCADGQIHDLLDFEDLHPESFTQLGSTSAQRALLTKVKWRLKRALGSSTCQWVGEKARAFRRTTKEALGILDYDLIHLTLPNSWSAYQGLAARRIATVHDLSNLVCPEHLSSSNRDCLHHGLGRIASEAEAILSVSEGTKRRLIEHYDVSPDRIHVTYEGCNKEHFRPVSDQRQLDRMRTAYGITNQPYLLSLGTLEPRKNLLNTIRAFRQLLEQLPDLDTQLIIAGGRGWGDFDELARAAQGCNRIRHIGYVHDDHLAALYSDAVAFTYVSFYEGFGLPPLEAMSCGTPVIYGSGSAMHEVVGDAGLAADPADVNDIKEKYRLLLTGGDLRRDLVDRALRRSQSFDWKQVAERTIEIYERCLGLPNDRSAQATYRARRKTLSNS